MLIRQTIQQGSRDSFFIFKKYFSILFLLLPIDSEIDAARTPFRSDENHCQVQFQ